MPIYFIQRLDSNLVKIGFTNQLNPKCRFRSIEREIQCQVRALKVIDGSFKIENVLHRQFSAFRVHGEWFEPCQELLDFIDKQPELHSSRTNLLASEVAKLLKVSTKTINRWIEAGYFPNAKRVNPRAGNSTYIIPETEVEQFIQERDKDKLN